MKDLSLHTVVGLGSGLLSSLDSDVPLFNDFKVESLSTSDLNF